ncbi:MAG: hypothetical protein Q4G02_00815 [bacterium]|nr:hypothetical protein [bacterium]
MADQTKKLNEKDLNYQLKTLGNRSYLLLSLIFFFSLLAVAIFGIIPEFGRITDLRAQLRQDKNNLAVIEQKLARIEDLVNDPEFAQAETLNRLLSSTNPFLEVLYAINELGKENNIVFTNYEYSPGLIATPSARLRAEGNEAAGLASTVDTTINTSEFSNATLRQQAQGFSISIEADGTYANIANFLQQIENVTPLSSVTYAEISNSLLGYASAKLEIMAHYFNPNVIAQLDEPLPTLNAEEKDLINNLDQFRVLNISDLNQEDIIGGKVDLFGNTNLNGIFNQDQTDTTNPN